MKLNIKENVSTLLFSQNRKDWFVSFTGKIHDGLILIWYSCLLNWHAYQGEDYDNLIFNSGFDIIKNNIKDKWNDE